MKFIGDIVNLTWLENDSEVNSDNIILEIGFRDNDGFPVNFINLSFGYEVIINGYIINSETFPKDDVQFISTNQDYMYSTIIDDLVPDSTYKIKVWAINDNKNFEIVSNFTTTIPESPYPSWHWDHDTHEWEPPTPMPPQKPGGRWVWDENAQQWIWVEDSE
jgi:hypothetical protein